MRVLSIASECAPLVKTGGLADVAGALPASTSRASTFGTRTPPLSSNSRMCSHGRTSSLSGGESITIRLGLAASWEAARQ